MKLNRKKYGLEKAKEFAENNFAAVLSVILLEKNYSVILLEKNYL